MRIRTIKPEFFLHEGLFEAERAAKLPLRLAFAGLWCAADREGRFKWEPRKLGIQILPYDQVDFSAVLDALESCGALLRYGDDSEFGCIPNFSKHQCVNVREAQSQIPPSPEVARESTVHARAGIARIPSGVNIPESLRETVFARDGRKCLRCKTENDLTVDHIFPQCMGGTHVLSNLRTLCRPCNSRRPVAGEAFIADLAVDGLTLNDMKELCMHVHARVEGKGKEKEGNKEGNGDGRTAPRSPQLPDEEWLKTLENDPTYQDLNIRQELGKMQRWCETNRKKPSRARFVNWINRAEKPIGVNGHRQPKNPAYNAETATAGMTPDQILKF